VAVEVVIVAAVHVAAAKVTALVAAHLAAARGRVLAVPRIAAAERVVRSTGIVKLPRAVRVIKDSALTRDSVLTGRARGSIRVAAAPAVRVVPVALVVQVVRVAVPATSAVAMPTPRAGRDHAPDLIEAPAAPHFDKARRIEYPALVRRVSLIRVLFAVLALQLAIGLQMDAYAMSGAMTVSTLQAGVLHMTSAQSQAGADACPLHEASSNDTSGAKVPKDNSAGKHDCCKSSCQCQCGSLPLAFNVSLTRGIPVTAYLRSVDISRVVNAPADTHFRPPIV
jgi:hypothetical protein